MNKSIISFFISALIGLGIGYVGFDIILADQGEVKNEATSSVPKQDSSSDAPKEKTEAQKEAKATTVSSDDNILKQKGCLGCHSVGDLNLQGGATGPDLSKAYLNVEGKHGKPLDKFLKEPSSAVMSGVIGGNPLSDEEIKQVVEFLKKASEAK